MAEFQVSLDPKQVNEAIASAVLRSALGDAIKKAVEKNVAALAGPNWDNPVDKVVKEVILDEVRRLVAGELPNIRGMVRDSLTDDRIGKILEGLAERMVRSAG